MISQKVAFRSGATIEADVKGVAVMSLQSGVSDGAW